MVVAAAVRLAAAVAVTVAAEEVVAEVAITNPNFKGNSESRRAIRRFSYLGVFLMEPSKD
jgi:hypothetical protein